jgi:hypothetical protein
MESESRPNDIEFSGELSESSPAFIDTRGEPAVGLEVSLYRFFFLNPGIPIRNPRALAQGVNYFGGRSHVGCNEGLGSGPVRSGDGEVLNLL